MSSTDAQIQRSIFSFEAFRQYYAGQVLSLLGDGFRTLAIPLLVFRISHSALSTGISYVCKFAPFALFILVAGSLADRIGFDRIYSRLSQRRDAGMRPLTAAELKGGA